MNFMPQGTPQLLTQPSRTANLASLMMPQAPAPRPSGMGSMFDPSKIMGLVKMREDRERQQAAQPVNNTTGNVVSPDAPYAKMINGLAGSENLFGSNGFVQRQFGAQPSAMNTFNGPPIGADPMAVQMTPTGFRGG